MMNSIQCKTPKYLKLFPEGAFCRLNLQGETMSVEELGKIPKYMAKSKPVTLYDQELIYVLKHIKKKHVRNRGIRKFEYTTHHTSIICLKSKCQFLLINSHTLAVPATVET